MSKSTTVHPRIHGEHLININDVYPKDGSSPYTRGTLASLQYGRYDPRFIPVYTGNTKLPYEFILTQSVHPRIHGEHGLLIYPTQDKSGSSPYTRGTRGKHLPSSRKSRFIPVYTGNTQEWGWFPGLFKVHPRIHGEHETAINGKVVENGSSPYTRGTPGKE